MFTLKFYENIFFFLLRDILYYLGIIGLRHVKRTPSLSHFGVEFFAILHGADVHNSCTIYENGTENISTYATPNWQQYQ